MSCLTTVERVRGNIFIRPSGWLMAGRVIGSHAHNFDHTMFIRNGSVQVRATLPDGTEIKMVVTALPVPMATHPEPLNGFDVTDGEILIRAGVEHEITALEDYTLYDCVYSHRTPDGQVSQTYTGWEAAYR